ncbi:MAG: malonyl-ACP O-methyltransferase BioC [Gammaproteobacteria bacterium]|nr:malonyl-ACP O-methyltransferase BioC [Gammaproteobacteria bacterium]
MSLPSAGAPPRGFRFDRPAVAAGFDRAAAGYDAAAQLQEGVRRELLGRLEYFRLVPGTVLDLGAGTGLAAVALRRRFRRAQVLAVDIAPGMLRAARRRRRPWRRFDCLCADAHVLPLRSASIDLIFSSLMLQWSDRPDQVFEECARVLKPGGLLLFSSFGPDTLAELREAWAAVDAAPRVSAFADMPDLAAALQHARFSEPVLDADRLVRYYADVRALMGELRAIGARNAAATRTRGLTGPGTLARMIDRYERRRTPQGIPATWEVFYGAAFAGGTQAGDSQAHAPGEHVVPLARLGRPRRRG